MGFDEKAFTAAIMGLAAKGYLIIEQDEAKTYKLARRKDATEKDSNLPRTKKSWRAFCLKTAVLWSLRIKTMKCCSVPRKGRDKPARHGGDNQLSHYVCILFVTAYDCWAGLAQRPGGASCLSGSQARSFGVDNRS